MDQLQVFSEPEMLPEELLQRCAALSVTPSAITDLSQEMNCALH